MLAFQKAQPIKTVEEAAGFETLLVVAQSPADIPIELGQYKNAIEQYLEVNHAAANEPVVIAGSKPSQIQDRIFKRIIFSPTGRLDRDYDDVRRFFDAGFAGIQRALAAGAENVVLVLALPILIKGMRKWLQADIVTLGGALHALYVPLELRELRQKSANKQTTTDDWLKLKRFGFYTAGNNRLERALRLANIFEIAKCVTRDVQGSDPERMAPPRVAEYLQSVFGKSDVVKISILDDQDKIASQYPCMGAVNRAARAVKCHQGRVVYLDYTPSVETDGDEQIEETICLVGKGICYDSGGADIKVGGAMLGMHRDKGGAAGIAGFFKVLDQLRPPNIRVLGALAVIRNSVGEECYVADEIVTARSGKRVRVGNTDAEGRMVMVDLLCEMRERILAERLPSPHCYTVATLTGHAILTVGDGYTIALDNGPAARLENAQKLQVFADMLGEPVEISTLRREDYAFHMGKSEYEDLLQCNNKASVFTPRGHQTPAAFLIMGSGLDAHGSDAETKGNAPISYTHLDINASEGPFPGIPMAAPVLALTAHYVLPRVMTV